MEFCPRCEVRLIENDSGFLECPKCGDVKENTDTRKTWTRGEGSGFTIEHDESMESVDRKEKWKPCSQKAEHFTVFLRDRYGAETKEEITSRLLTYLAKRWFYCHVCGKHFEEDQIIWYHMEEEYKWCHDKCRGFEKLTDSNPSRKTGIDLQIWRKGQRGFDTTGGGW